jgi:uncharacterized small protein (TIGR04563 family)
MAGPDKRKQSLYFPAEMLGEIQAEAARQDRSLSWVMQQAWRIAKSDLRAVPTLPEALGELDATPRRKAVA